LSLPGNRRQALSRPGRGAERYGATLRRQESRDRRRSGRPRSALAADRSLAWRYRPGAARPSSRQTSSEHRAACRVSRRGRTGRRRNRQKCRWRHSDAGGPFASAFCRLSCSCPQASNRLLRPRRRDVVASRGHRGRDRAALVAVNWLELGRAAAARNGPRALDHQPLRAWPASRPEPYDDRSRSRGQGLRPGHFSHSNSASPWMKEAPQSTGSARAGRGTSGSGH